MEAQLKQRAIIKIFSIEGRTADEFVHGDYLSMEKLPTFLRSYKWIREFWTRRTSTFDEPRSGQLPIDHIEVDIFASLNVNSFHTVRTLACVL
jgi:hypothetical protein